MKNTYIPRVMKVADVIKETKDIVTLRINDTLNPEPGQFFEVSIPGIGEAPFGSASYNYEYYDLTVRSVGNLSQVLQKLKSGDKIGIRGPVGYGFPMEKFKGKDLVIVAGGTGVAPIRSVIEFVEKKRKWFKDVYIYFGFRSPEEFLYTKDLKKWEKSFKFVLTIDKPYESWKGKVGFLNAVIEESGVSPDNKVVIMCGPPIMIQVTAGSMNKMGFTDDQIYVSLERMMQCGVGMCGHCQVGNKYVCKDGPVFRYDEVKQLRGE